MFLVSKPAFQCNSLMVVGTVGYTRSRVPVDGVACFEVVFGDVVVEVTLFSSSFVFV